MGEERNTNPGAKARTKAGSEADTFRNHSGSADRKR